METVKTYQCTRCEHQTRIFWGMIKHYEYVHSNEAGFRIVCGVDNCYCEYANVTCLCRHMRQKHVKYYAELVASGSLHSATGNDPLVQSDSTFSVDCAELIDHCDELIQDLTPQSERASLQNDHIALNFVASLSLRLREVDKVSGNTCQEIRSNIGTMLDTTRHMLFDCVQKRLSEQAVSAQVLNIVCDVFSQPTALETACQSLAKEQSVNRYVESNFPYVEPIQYNLDSGKTDQHSTMQYVSILDTLKMLLQNDEIFSAVVNGHQSLDGKLRDVCDGSHYQQHPMFNSSSQQQPVLQIMLYYDDFGAVNPLGHRAKKYKIAGFYFMLGNIAPKYRSRLQSINLVALCFSNALKKFGFASILSPLIKDLTVLAEKGVTVVRPDGVFTFKGSLLLLVADNLGAHSIGGYLESFTTIHPCRFCMVGKDKLRTTLRSDNCSLRTPDSYDLQVKRAAIDKAFQKVYGVKGNSCLNVLPNFHVTSGMPSDIMHDLLEGVVVDVMECVVLHYVSKGIITWENLNEIVANFPYQANDKENKPDVVTESNFKFKQTAAKNRCFLRLLPLLIGDKIAVGDGKWEVLLLLLNLHDLAFSPVMSVIDTVLLDDAVEVFLLKFNEEFPDCNFKPKMHYLTHYGSHCRAFGPLVNYWGFRFEAKHGYFKDISVRMKCRRNVLKSMAKKHQYKQCWFLKSGSYISREQVSNTGGQLVPLNSFPYSIQEAVRPFSKFDHLFTVTGVEVEGFAYTCDMAVAVGVSNCEIKFGLICAIIVQDGTPHLVVCHLDNQEYLRHYHMYCSKQSTSYCVLNINDRHGDALVSLARTSSMLKPHRLFMELNAVDEADTAEKKRDHMWRAALLSLPYLFGEKLDSMIKEAESFEHEVFLHHNKERGLFILFVDAQAVCTSVSFEKSFGLLFAVYYVFNLVISKNMRRTIAFIQKYACAIKDEGLDSFMSRAQQHCVSLMEKLTMKPIAKSKKQQKSAEVVVLSPISTVGDEVETQMVSGAIVVISEIIEKDTVEMPSVDTDIIVASCGESSVLGAVAAEKSKGKRINSFSKNEEILSAPVSRSVRQKRKVSKYC